MEFDINIIKIDQLIFLEIQLYYTNKTNNKLIILKKHIFMMYNYLINNS